MVSGPPPQARLPETTARLVSGWGRTARTRSNVVAAGAVRDIRAGLASAGPRGVLARGLGRSYGDVAQNAGGSILDMTGLSAVEDVDVERGHVTVAGGTSIDRLLRELVPQGWFVPVTPGTRFATIGGAIANDVHGKNHHRDGSIGDHVESIRLVTASGDVMDIAPGTPEEAFEATVGGIGLTGIIAEATLRLVPIQTTRMRVDTDRATDLDDLMALMADGDHRYRYSVAWIDCLARGRRLGRGVLTRGDHATARDLGPASRGDVLRFGQEPTARVPSVCPRLVGPWSARAFNEAWYRASPRRERGRLASLASFFYPLDAIGDWNRLYGARGLLQYQFVVPFGREDVVQAALEGLSASACPSMLGVLKRFGHGRGMMSFPIPGWTLALDIPAGAPGVANVLHRLDHMVADAGGRVYLAKDARLDPGALPDMYSELSRWRDARDRLDPRHTFRSDLDRRLLERPATLNATIA
jgi:decaprenylphospho-beta-D-ribofuranose 2-oxidase